MQFCFSLMKRPSRNTLLNALNISRNTPYNLKFTYFMSDVYMLIDTRVSQFEMNKLKSLNQGNTVRK